jgi:hypothetical protein
MILVLLACAHPDPTQHLGPETIQWAPANLDDEAVRHRRWLDRWAVVGTTRDPDVGAAVQGYADLPPAEAIEVLKSELHGRHAHDAAHRLTHSFGADGCRAVLDAWNDGTQANRHEYESALLGDCTDAVDLSATPRGRAALARVQP